MTTISSLEDDLRKSNIIVTNYAEAVRKLEAERDAQRERAEWAEKRCRELEVERNTWKRHAIALAAVPAVRDALGTNHVGGCWCPLCCIDDAAEKDKL